jgi:NTP pyrophosphatase (non-canonical NTP hydrolase)
MTLEEYQKEANKTAAYPCRGDNLLFLILGLAGEIGEVSDCVKNNYNCNENEFSGSGEKKLISQLGDALWYISQIAFELGISIEDIAKRNVKKINSEEILARNNGV